jgi:hypothetical protein
VSDAPFYVQLLAYVPAYAFLAWGFVLTAKRARAR